ncbi:centromere protein K [Gastrophryne carolinensis]
MDDLDELLKETELLARHMSSYQHDLPPDLQSDTQVSEETKNELMQQCEDLWAELGQYQNKVMVLDEEKLPESDVQLYLLMLKVKALTAEYEQWEKREPEIISQNQEILLAAGKEELQNVDQGLEMMLSYVRAKNKKLKSDLEKEQRWLNEQQEAVDAISTKLEELKNQSANSSDNSLHQELKAKLKKIETYKDELLAALGDFLSEHFPLPELHAADAKIRKTATQEPQVKWVPLEDIIETLITKLMDSPHDPYIQIKKEFWPPYIEMLLRYGIALRHPQDSSRIRLEAFHQ